MGDLAQRRWINCSESYYSKLHCELRLCFSDASAGKVYELPPEETLTLFSRVLKADTRSHPAASDVVSSTHGQERGSGVQQCPDTTAQCDSPHSQTHSF